MWVCHCRRHLRRHRRYESRKTPGQDLACFGFWYADDGQYVCRPGDVDVFLECLDRAATKAGLTRGTGREVKSTVRLIRDDTAVVSFHEQQEESWITSRIRDTFQILAPQQ